MTERIFIRPQDPSRPRCDEIEPHLAMYWQGSDSLALQSLALIQLHLQTCLGCQAKFAAIMQNSSPPWQET